MISRRTFLRTGAAAAASGAACFGYATLVEPHWLEFVERELPIDHLPAALDGARLAQISDIHVGPRVDDDFLIESFARLRRYRPDIVVVTGDFITHVVPRRDEQYAQLRAVLTHVPAGRLGTFGILGNHDYGMNWSQPQVATRVVEEAGRAGIQILRNESHAVSGLELIGVDDLWARQSNPLAAQRARTSDAALVLVHNPDTADEHRWGDYQGWMLAGHTHGGQCRPPFLPPPILPVQNRRYAAGTVAAGGGRALYINRGLGHLIQARFNVRPEITLFTLRRAAGATRADS
jgi:predicted MPP superfamily phosphohydrolase